MTIGIASRSDSASITVPPRFRFGSPSLSRLRLEPLDATALTGHPDERDPRGGGRAGTILNARISSNDANGPSERKHEERGQNDACRCNGRERLEATDARIHLATGGEPTTVGFGVFTNETTFPATLVGLDSPAFDRVEMRETFAIGDVTMMRRTERLTVLPGDSVEFSSLGRRLMMSGPRQPLEEGQLIGITMRFASGRPRVVPFRVVTHGVVAEKS